jgi:hydroxymethylpyrimidine pyrophosphatase-like HAD family hydrolase
MRPRVLAIDYDGTVAEHGVFDPGVRAAIQDVRERGLRVVLVTGRRLSDLREVAGDLRFADAVVGENGAVYTIPGTGRSSVLAPRPPGAFVDRLRRQGLDIAVGECIVEAHASDATAILRVVREMELPLALLFNRGRLMVLPQSVSKGTGLRHALRTLRLSLHNTVAIGDAENDHELLAASEVGVAVGWGSPALAAVADETVDGRGPADLAPFIRALPDRSVLRPSGPVRRRLLLGHAADGTELSLAVRGRNVLVAGEPRSGKSWVAGLLCEQLILHGYTVCVIDPEGDYLTLEPLPNVMIVGGDDSLPSPQEMSRLLRHADVSLVVDLSRKPRDEKVAYTERMLAMLKVMRREHGVPHRILLDEAHYFLTDGNASDLLDLDMQGYTFVTYRVSSLPSSLLDASRVVLVSQESDAREVEALHRAFHGRGTPEEWGREMADLALGEVALLSAAEEAGGEVRRLRLIPRLTPHVRHRAKYIDVPVSDRHAFVFTDAHGPTGVRARTLQEFVEVVCGLPTAVIDGHLRRRDFSRWIAEVYGDVPLSRELFALEEAFAIGHVLDPAETIAELVHERYAG